MHLVILRKVKLSHGDKKGCCSNLFVSSDVMPYFATVRDVFHAARAEAGVGGVVIDRRQDMPAAFAFVAVGFLYGDGERIAFLQADGRGDEEEA